MPEDSQRTGAISVIRLARWQRMVAATTGLALVAIGAVATFRNHDGAASAAMILMGGLAVLLAILGVFPSRMKMGDYEFDLFVDRVLEKLPEDARDEVEPAIAEAAVEAGMPVSPRIASTSSYFRGVWEALRDAQLPAEIIQEAVAVPGLEFRPDFLVLGAANRHDVAIDIRYSAARLYEANIKRFAEYAKRRTADRKPTIPVIVMPEEPLPDAARWFADGGIKLFVWRSTKDNGILKDGLMRLLHQEPSG